MDYPFYKMLHLLGVIIFMGNIIVTALWKVLADRTQKPSVLAFAQRLVTLTDLVFTSIGVIFIVVTGVIMSEPFGGKFGQNWLIWGWSLFAASGLIWLVILVPIQIKQAKMAVLFEKSGNIPDEYWKLARRWNFFGFIATLLPLFNLYFMVFKPT